MRRLADRVAPAVPAPAAAVLVQASRPGPAIRALEGFGGFGRQRERASVAYTAESGETMSQVPNRVRPAGSAAAT
ncbi:hypothetical protein ACFVZR_39580 [Streptomyces sp. NPDC058316]|uniref:hypothetical protein n=1 Tax=unclassified Streptomyces TaxID=2593676 RepID=UPI003333E18B